MSSDDSKKIPISEDELKEMLKISASLGTKEAANNFFNRFEFYFNFHEEKNNEKTIKNGIALLNTCKRIDSISYEILHKGSPFYWIALASFIVGDYQQATFFFDAAISEDNKNDPGSITPAHLFVLMDSSDPRQFGRPLTQRAEIQLDKFISGYNKDNESYALSKEILRNKFIRIAVTTKEKWRSLATSLVSFLLELEERERLLSLRLEGGTYEPFFIHLMKGCVLFESLIKSSPFVESKFNFNQIKTKDLNYFLNNKKIKEKLGYSDQLKLSSTLDQIILNLQKLQSSPSIIQSIEFTGKIRNSLSHFWAWEIKLDSEIYKKIATVILNSCFFIISNLY